MADAFAVNPVLQKAVFQRLMLTHGIFDIRIDHVNQDFIIGALSLVIWTVTLLTTVKYVLIAMKADNHNEGGIFALYSLVKNCGRWLIMPAMIGGAALLADGILTPAVTVTTAIEGLRTIDFVHRLIGDGQGIVVAITHSCTLNCTLTKLLGEPISYYPKIKSGDNTAVTKLEVDEDGNVEVIYINDDSHLPPELLRQNYTGRGPETNFDFEYISFPQDDERYAAAVAQACEQLPDCNDAADIRARVEESLAQNSNYAFFPVLMDRVCGVVTVKKDAAFPADHGLMTGMFVADDLRNKGYTEQAFGEAIDVLRRRGCRYLVVENKADPHFQLLIGRFIFEPMPDHEGYMRMRITVPGVEGPVYG